MDDAKRDIHTGPLGLLNALKSRRYVEVAKKFTRERGWSGL